MCSGCDALNSNVLVSAQSRQSICMKQQGQLLALGSRIHSSICCTVPSGSCAVLLAVNQGPLSVQALHLLVAVGPAGSRVPQLVCWVVGTHLTVVLESCCITRGGILYITHAVCRIACVSTVQHSVYVRVYFVSCHQQHLRQPTPPTSSATAFNLVRFSPVCMVAAGCRMYHTT